ncbi:MAG: EamA family transporter [Gallionella sp.]|nr:EamA family transporter [Gallionella sp.]
MHRQRVTSVRTDRQPASDTSLMLNAEGVFTALLAWFAFKENFDRGIALGMVAIVTGAIVLSWPGQAKHGSLEHDRSWQFWEPVWHGVPRPPH